MVSNGIQWYPIPNPYQSILGILGFVFETAPKHWIPTPAGEHNIEISDIEYMIINSNRWWSMIIINIIIYKMCLNLFDCFFSMICIWKISVFMEKSHAARQDGTVVLTRLWDQKLRTGAPWFSTTKSSIATFFACFVLPNSDYIYNWLYSNCMYIYIYMFI